MVENKKINERNKGSIYVSFSFIFIISQNQGGCSNNCSPPDSEKFSQFSKDV